MIKKYFTPLEVNNRLPLIKQIVGDILIKAAELKAFATNGIGPLQQKLYDKILEQMSLFIDELEALGCFYKDWNFEKGLVDFPALIDGKEVLLCWHSDEPDVRWYHSLEEGFPGRRLIPEHLLSDPAQATAKDLV